MKAEKFYLLTVLVFMAAIFTGCSTIDKFKVTSSQSTKIYLPDDRQKPVGTASRTPLEIKVPSDSYYGYILATDPATGILVPFGVDVKKKGRFGEKMAIGTGYTLTSLGLGATLLGCIGMIAANSNEDEDNTSLFAAVTGAGAGVAALGAALGGPAHSRLAQLSHHYQFAYDSNQTVDFGNLSPALLNPDPEKGVSEIKVPARRVKATSGKSDVDVNAKSSRVSAGRSDKAKKIAGTYSGFGKLLKGSSEEESYSSVSVRIERIDKNKVRVFVIESDEDFFEEPLVYVINAADKGSYTLSLENMPSEKIEIDNKGRLKFSHGKVCIDDIIYTLKISANKD